MRLQHSEKLRCFYLDAARTRLEKNERVAPRAHRFHYERAYRASTFEITNLSAQKTRYVKAICLCAQARRNALSQRVSTALRCLGLKITLLFKLTRLKTREN